MKKIYTIIVLIGTLVSSCDSYFDVELHQNIPADNAYNTVSDITNALNGAYYALGTYRFQGRNVPALGDLASDNGIASATSGHFVAISTYTYSETTGDFSDIWTYGYQVVDRTTRVINGAKALLAKGSLSEADQSTLNSAIAQSYALRAYSAFMMVNIFGLPYGTDNDANGGLVVVEAEPIEAGVNVSRASVKDTYDWILRDIKQANTVPNVVTSSPQFYFNPAAVKALEARVNLYMKNYGVAKEAAQKAIDLRGANPVSDAEYVEMWKSIAISGEDIFTIPKTTDDNLSANALNTLYGTYKSTMTADLAATIGANDIRKKLIGTSNGVENHPKKFDGIQDAAAVNNIPVFRVSEMYLIIAEVCAQTGDSGAQEALFFTAKRNKDITAASQLPSSKDALLTFISVERRREFFAEGQRWYDARRTGEKIMLNDGNVQNFDVAKIVMPIPSSEINAGFGVQQNPTWKESMPVQK